MGTLAVRRFAVRGTARTVGRSRPTHTSGGVSDTFPIALRDRQGRVVRVSKSWLLDHADEHRNALSRQRDVLVSELSEETLVIEDLAVDGDTISAAWALHGGHSQVPTRGQSTVATSRIPLAHSIGSGSPPVTAWGRDLPLGLGSPVCFPGSALENPAAAGAHRCLASLREFGVLFLTGMPSTKDATRALVAPIGAPQRTFYGEMWSTRSEEASAPGTQDTAYLNVAIKPHTDGTYFRDPPGLQVLNCVSQAEQGGETLLVDGEMVVRVLREESPSTLDFFARTRIPWFSYDADIRLSQLEPVVRLEPNGRLDHIRFNEYDRGDLCPGEWYDDVFLPHWKTLVHVVNRESLIVRIRLRPGDAVVVNNHRVLHGRTAFDGGVREMIGCYIARDDFESNLRLAGILPMCG